MIKSEVATLDQLVPILPTQMCLQGSTSSIFCSSDRWWLIKDSPALLMKMKSRRAQEPGLPKKNCMSSPNVQRPLYSLALQSICDRALMNTSVMEVMLTQVTIRLFWESRVLYFEQQTYTACMIVSRGRERWGCSTWRGHPL